MKEATISTTQAAWTLHKNPKGLEFESYAFNLMIFK